MRFKLTPPLWDQKPWCFKPHTNVKQRENKCNKKRIFNQCISCRIQTKVTFWVHTSHMWILHYLTAHWQLIFQFFLIARFPLQIRGTRYLSRVQSGGQLGPGRSHPCRDKTKPQSPASGCWQDTAHTCHQMLQLWRSQADILQTQKYICMSRWTRTIVTSGYIPNDTVQSQFLQIIQASLKDQ